MFSLPRESDDPDDILNSHIEELAMFRRWCEEIGSGPMSPVRLVQISALILAREKYTDVDFETLYIALMACDYSDEDADSLRYVTRFDDRIEEFCASIGIKVPHREVYPPPSSRSPAKKHPP
ncbi:hypothetical protein AWB71_06022 [Caballeronia peredens]|nr:hypothetical protein AWB71_06022 [Caballeronia peredens]